jgi:hypothetical protein
MKWRELFPQTTTDEELLKVCRNCNYDDDLISGAIERLWEVSSNNFNDTARAKGGQGMEGRRR